MRAVAIITTCTGRKRLPVPVAARFRNVGAATAKDAARVWFSRLEKCAPRVRADELYCGRGFAEARHAARISGADLFIASAGLGLLAADAAIPPYDATVASASPDGICERFAVSASQWWQIVSGLSPFASCRPPDDRLILVAASSPYLKLLGAELLLRGVTRLRIFSRGRPEDLPPELRLAMMPYGPRFDADNGPIPGTIGDFPQRALRHFVQYVLSEAPDSSAEEHARLVRDQLRHLSAPERRPGKRATDHEVKAAIEAHFESVGGRSSHMLRKLRDEVGIACEQGRFRDLFKQVSAGRDAASCLPL